MTRVRHFFFLCIGLMWLSASGCGDDIKPDTSECRDGGDCQSGVCSEGVCQEPTCSDQVYNGLETDTDCGGGCGPCGDGMVCFAESDCQSQVCEGGFCAVPRCGDGIINQAGEDCEQGAVDTAECDYDCTAIQCGDGYTNTVAGEECDDGNDDDSDECTTVCEVSDCDDGIMNVDEIDVDCGGHCGLESCDLGQVCNENADCGSLWCPAGECERSEAVVTGSYHTCGLYAGYLHCWGSNGYGQLGYGHTQTIGDNEAPSVAGAVDLGGDLVVKMMAGAYHTCVTLQSGALRCWGRNSEGQLGYGHTMNIGDDELPSAAGDVDVGGAVAQIAAGLAHTCALLETGAVRCWGDNTFGQLGYGNTDIVGDDEAPSVAGDVPLGGTAIQITAGRDHTCALLDTGAIRCWGYNEYGQLGHGNQLNIGDDEAPSAAGDVPLGGTAVHVDAGWFHTCAILDTGAMKCWGGNSYGQLGYGNQLNIGDDELPSVAGDISLAGPVTQINAATYHTCAQLDTGDVQCWGYNTFGSLGYGNTSPIGDNELPSTAGLVDIGGAITQLFEGLGHHTCVVLAAGGMRCWGYNSYGSLGYGNTQNIGDNELPYEAGNIPYL